MLTNSELRTIQFYQWDERCRGWYLYERAVDLEPPFEPFGIRYSEQRFVDDGKVPSLFQKAASLLKGIAGKTETPLEPESIFTELAPYYTEQDAPLRAIKISVPKGNGFSSLPMEQLLFMLSMATYQVSFEIHADSERIVIYIVCREPDYRHVSQHLRAYIPTAILTDELEVPNSFLSKDASGYIIDFGLSEEFMRPISIGKSNDTDSYINLFAIMNHLEEGDKAVYQVLFQGAFNPWATEILRSVSDGKNGSFFEDAPEMVQLAKEKVASPLCGVAVRIYGRGKNVYASQQLAYGLAQAVSSFTRSTHNSLVALLAGEGPNEFYTEDIYFRASHRLGMLLNCKELATLVHLPKAEVVSEKLAADGRKSKAAPKIAIDNPFVLGLNSHQGKEVSVTVSTEHRLRHMHVIGATGTGKSTFLLNCIVQDINTGTGVAVLDPHGDLIDSILERIPTHRLQDVVVIDPADGEYPVAFNILSAHSEIEKNILSSDLVAVFRRLSTSWGDQMNSVFANAILAYLESNKGGTLIDLRRFLIEKSFREEFLATVSDPSIRYYWQKEFPLLKTGSIGPILTRLDSFLRPKLIRNMVAQPKGLDFEDFLDSGKIVLVKLSQGLIGTENSYLLGTFVVAKLHQAALARQAKARETRQPFYVYIDEFQHFITPSMVSILSGARKYGLGLILAHQDMQQLLKEDSELASSVTANAGIKVAFRLGDTDAKRFEQTFSSFDSKDLQNLEIGQAIARIERPEWSCSVSIQPLPKVHQLLADQQKEAVIAYSRSVYGTPRKEVEDAFAFLSSKDDSVKEKKATVPPLIVEQETIVNKVEEEVTAVNVSEPIKLDTPTEHIDIAKEGEKFTQAVEEQRELREHLYLQEFVKKLGEQWGFKSELEVPTGTGGRIDVVLIKNDMRIACEISVTNTVEYEVKNLKKCLEAGYGKVVMLCNNETHLRNIQQEAYKEITSAETTITFCSSSGFSDYMDTLDASLTNIETRIKGYRVKTTYHPSSRKS